MFKFNFISDEDTRKALSLSVKTIKNRTKYADVYKDDRKRIFLYGLVEFSKSLVVLASGGRYVGYFGAWLELMNHFDEKDRQERLSKEMLTNHA